jgi:hypothetical protein
MTKSNIVNFGTKLKKWKPGQSGNPKGRPPKLVSITSYLKKDLATIDEKTGKTYAEIVAQKLIDLALGGDLEAIKEILNRIDGKVLDKHEIDANIPVTLIFTPAYKTEPETLPSPQGSLIDDSEKSLLTGG